MGCLIPINWSQYSYMWDCGDNHNFYRTKPRTILLISRSVKPFAVYRVSIYTTTYWSMLKALCLTHTHTHINHNWEVQAYTIPRIRILLIVLASQLVMYVLMCTKALVPIKLEAHDRIGRSFIFSMSSTSS